MRQALPSVLYRAARRVLQPAIEVVYLAVLLFVCLFARLWPKRIDVGLGPEPLINNVYHKSALLDRGYSAETFVTSVYFITKSFDRRFIYASRTLTTLLIHLLHMDFLLAVFRYRCLYVYFNGGPLYATRLLWRFEPLLLSLAGVKTVVMPYGSDVQDLTRCPNLLFRHVTALDSPEHRLRRGTIARKIDLWTAQATHVISGCDWVDYMHFWHTLMVAHFSIDTDLWRPTEPQVVSEPSKPLRVLHAPNHRYLKGTQYFIRAVEDLRAEGYAIELVLLEGVPNEQVREVMQTVDLVADQLIIGWYAMFAIEAMALGKPVLCYLRDDLREFYVSAGLLHPDEPPLINCSVRNVKDVMRQLVENRHQIAQIGAKSRTYVERLHSTKAVGAIFEKVNRSIKLEPSLTKVSR